MSHDRVAIVTGAFGGMGVAFTYKLLGEGWRVARFDLQQAIDAAPPDNDDKRVVALACDVADYTSVERAVGTVRERFGKVDAVVNGAGIVANIASIARMDPAKWAWELGVNLSGPFHLIKATAPAMAESGWGRFVNISSQAAQVGLRYQSAYCASKAGLLGLMRVVVAEYGHKGVTCNTLLPGLIATPKVLGMPPDILQRAIEGVPAGRPGTVEEMAEMAAFLMTDKAGFINGASIDIDGGKHVQISDLTRRRPP